MNLENLGWGPFFEEQVPAIPEDDLVPARVCREDRGRCRVIGDFGELPAELSGRLRRDRLPAVGDWTLVRLVGGGGAVVRRVLARRSRFRRKVAGAASRQQVLAANVDVAFVVTGLDGNFSLRRIERYLTLAHESGAEPVVVLNKADLADDPELAARQAEDVAPGVAVLATAATTGAGVEEVRARLGPGRTGVFLGSSGVGKTSLVNRLLGVEAFATREVRASDSKGRHATVRRELVVLPDRGGVVIDVPGLREVQLPGGTGLAESFADVSGIARECRFRDCRHRGEPGCAVAEALRDGRLDRERFESWLELRREQAYQERRVDERARREEEDRWRRIAIASRKMKKRRPGGR